MVISKYHAVLSVVFVMGLTGTARLGAKSDPKAKIDIANDFINWLIGPEVQEIMGVYGEAEYGRSLFNPIGRGAQDGSAELNGFPPVEDYTVPVPAYTK